MFEVESYMERIVSALREKWGDRLVYVGLQGSYLRGEATENSDVDVAVVVDGLTADDLAVYRDIVWSLENPEKSCGFICGTEELKNWNPLEICGFRHGTKDYYGNIRDLFPAYTDGDVINYVKLSVGNLYHEICHRYVHGDAETNRCALPYAYKSVFFILQSVYFLKTGVYYPTKQELMRHLTDADLSIMEKGMELSRRDDYDFEEAFRSLLSWCGEVLSSF